ncbi:MAG: DUF624 domain-containing protein [Oscillospiraceae bacterium]
MGGFLGFGNHAKPGKGIKKEKTKKKRFFEFFDLLSRKITKLVKLNMLFILYCAPIIIGLILVYTNMSNSNNPLSEWLIYLPFLFIGPPLAALFKITKYYVEEKPVFLLSDFFDAFKENFVQSLFAGMFFAALIVACTEGIIFYIVRLSVSPLYWIPFILIALLTIVTIFAGFYVFLIIISVRLNMFAIIKNAFMFCFIGAKTNIITFFFVGVILVPSFLFVPFSLIFVAIISLSLSAIIITFNSFQYIYEFLIKPYYVQNGLENPYEKEEIDEDSIFQDATK